MLKKTIILTFCFICLVACSNKPVSLLTKLNDLSGIRIEQIEAPDGYTQAFAIYVTQNIDHQNPDTGTFTQRIFLSHIDEDRPMVFVTSGYGASRNRTEELAVLLDANQIRVPHRYFPDARPDVLDWQYLTIRQAAADHHHIISLFKTIYQGKWISTGASKGGMTAFFHRRFYPSDVDVTVPYVAPLIFGTEDPRFEQFLLHEVGDEVCRNKIKQFQRQLLLNRDRLLPYVYNYALNRNLTFSLGEEKALEYSILEYIFAFWQYGDGDCSKIPGPDASVDEMVSHLSEVSPFYYYTDEGIAYYESFFYQAFTELGYCPYLDEHVKDLLLEVPNPSYRVFAPRGVDMLFKPEVMHDIDAWIQEEGNYMIYIYGGVDPWTAGAVRITANTNALRIIQPGANHGVKIMDLDERDLVLNTLEQWLNIDIDVTGKVVTAYDQRSELQDYFKRIIE